MQGWQRNHISEYLSKLIQITMCNHVFLAKVKSFLSLEEHQLLTASYTRGAYVEAANSLYFTALTRHSAYEIMTKALLDTNQTDAFRILIEGWIKSRNKFIFQSCDINYEENSLHEAMRNFDWKGYEAENITSDPIISRSLSVHSLGKSIYLIFLLVAILLALGFQFHKIEEELATTKLELKNLQGILEKNSEAAVLSDSDSGLLEEVHAVYLDEVQTANQFQRDNETSLISTKSSLISHEKAVKTTVEKLKGKLSSDPFRSTCVDAAKLFLKNKYKEEVSNHATIAIDFGSRYSRTLVNFKGNVQRIPHYDQSGTTYQNTMANYIGVGSYIGCIGHCALKVLRTSENVCPIVYDVKEVLQKWSDFEDFNNNLWGFYVAEPTVPHYQPSIHLEAYDYSITSLVSKLFKQLLQNAEKFLEASVRNCVVTVPNNFHEKQRQVILEASIFAGCLQTSLLEEDVAAAIASRHVTKPQFPQRNLLIIQLGAYYWRYSIIKEFDKFSYEILVTKADRGGFSLQYKLMEYCVNEFILSGKIFHSQLEIFKDLGTKFKIRQLFENCETAIVSLSTVPLVTIYISDFFQGRDLVVNITRTGFEKLNEDEFKGMINDIGLTVEEFHHSKEEIDEFILVGGQSLIPIVKRILKDLFKWRRLDFMSNIKPDEVVVYGAAVKGLLPD